MSICVSLADCTTLLHFSLRAETTRIMLRYGGIEFEDSTFTMEQVMRWMAPVVVEQCVVVRACVVVNGVDTVTFSLQHEAGDGIF